MKQILINKKQVSELLGGISESQVLRYVRTKRLPCIRITRHSILFDINEIQKWSATRPRLRKTVKQQAEAKRRREEAEQRRTKKQLAERHEMLNQYYAENRAIAASMEQQQRQEALRA